MADNQNSSGWGQAAAAAIQTGGQVAVDAARNKRQWRYQQKAMDKQQQLNLETWNMQNAYNTPQAQMQRLQEAGLNPRLIYGQGSSAPNMAGPLQAPEVPTRQATGATVPANKLMEYYQIRQMDAQYRNTTMATDLMQKTAALKDLETGLKNLNLMKETLRSKNYEGVVQTEQAMQRWVGLRSEELLINEQKKGRIMDQLGTMRDKQLTGLDLDNTFKQYRNDLAKLGIYSSDHPAMRVLIQASKRMNIDLGELLMQGAEKLKYLLDIGK